MADNGRQHGSAADDAGIDAAAVREAWLRKRPLIRAALAHGGGRFSEEDVLERVLDGSASLWEGRESFAVTEVVKYPQRTVFRVWLAGGNLEELLNDWLPFGLEIAKRLRADTFEVMGRPGWARVLGREGFQHRYTVMEYEL